MLWASLFTAPFGLMEPLFVPEYWCQRSLFDLARTTGFDIESLIFCFGISGIGAVLYNLLTGQQLQAVPTAERQSLHRWALATPFIAFPILYSLPWNPIYPSIVPMILGAIAAIMCRPDLSRKTWIGALLFRVPVGRAYTSTSLGPCRDDRLWPTLQPRTLPLGGGRKGLRSSAIPTSSISSGLAIASATRLPITPYPFAATRISPCCAAILRSLVTLKFPSMLSKEQSNWRRPSTRSRSAR